MKQYDEKDIVEDGVASVVARSLVKFKLEDSNEPFEKLCAVKIAPANKKASKEPHDIVKEIRILSRLANQNVCHKALWLYLCFDPYVLTDRAIL